VSTEINLTESDVERGVARAIFAAARSGNLNPAGLIVVSAGTRREHGEQVEIELSDDSRLVVTVARIPPCGCIRPAGVLHHCDGSV
jgi:hypothetical protein